MAFGLLTLPPRLWKRRSMRVTDMTILAGRHVQNASHADGPRDRIFIRDYVIPVYVGVYPEEQGVTQNVGFSIEAIVGPEVKSVNDQIAEVPSYDNLMQAVKDVTGAGHINLVETMADRIATHILADGRIASVRIRIEKLDRDPAAVGVEIVRPRGGLRHAEFTGSAR